jgi:hypothetical protein
MKVSSKSWQKSLKMVKTGIMLVYIPKQAATHASQRPPRTRRGLRSSCQDREVSDLIKVKKVKRVVKNDSPFFILNLKMSKNHETTNPAAVDRGFKSFEDFFPFYIS